MTFCDDVELEGGHAANALVPGLFRFDCTLGREVGA